MKRSGFSLIEVLVGGFLLGVVGLAIVGLQAAVSESQTSTWVNYISIDEADSNVASLVREIRGAQPSDNGGYPLTLAGDQEIIFFSDIDDDGSAERIRYSLDGTTLSKGTIDPTGFPMVTYQEDSEVVKIVSENVRNGPIPIFYYYNGNWPSDSANNPLPGSDRLQNTKLIKVNLRLNTRQDPGSDYLLESFTQMRIVKDNI